jgi:outer membrane protein OmpA-like peptidoglycan-associated protein
MNIRGNHDRRRAGPSTLVALDVLLLMMILVLALHTIMVSRLSVVGPVAKYQREFWRERANELCVEPNQTPSMPELAADADPLRKLAFLKQLTSYSQTVWRLYEECGERKLVITEELLRFKVDKHNQFEAKPNPEEAFTKIRNYADKNIQSHNQIYIMGHTDDTDEPDYNYQLSYRRALEIAMVIQRHLSNAGKEPGKDYALYPVGLGESQLLARKADDNLTVWRAKCRRIELVFRNLRGGQQNSKQ